MSGDRPIGDPWPVPGVWRTGDEWTKISDGQASFMHSLVAEDRERIDRLAAAIEVLTEVIRKAGE